MSGEPMDLDRSVIYRCVVGSRAFGQAEAGSDTDRRGIYLPPAALHWSLAGVPQQIERPQTQETYWEIQKFLTLALKANPTALECLYTPLVETATPLARELLAMRSAFLSRRVFQTYHGYAESAVPQAGAGPADAGEHPLEARDAPGPPAPGRGDDPAEGTVPVDLGAHRDRLLAVRRGELAWEGVDAWRHQLLAALAAALPASPLPDEPDVARVDAFLIRARRSIVE